MTMRERIARAICLTYIRANGVGDEVDPFGWTEYLAEADAVLAEIEAAGMVLVPKEPTEAMKDAAYDRMGAEAGADYPSPESSWEAMLSAAPAVGE